MNPDVLHASIPFSLRRLGVPRNEGPRTFGPSEKQIVLSDQTRQCIRRLAAYKPPPPPEGVVYPLSRAAAVLVALFVGRTGELYILLNRRAETLRAFPGDTSLPGGRWEAGDRTLEDTARREAWEEIGIPIDRQRVPFLCYLQPFLTGSNLVVTPVVVLILDPNIRPILNEPEVSALFAHPFKSFLARTSPFPDGLHHNKHLADPRVPPAKSEFYGKPPLKSMLSSDRRKDHDEKERERERGQQRALSGNVSEHSVIPDLPSPLDTTDADQGQDSNRVVDPEAPTLKNPSLSPSARASAAASLGWKKYYASSEPPPPDGQDGAPEMEYYSYRDIQWGQGPVRMHRFLTGREDAGIRPVYGLTAAILLHAATVGYARTPEFPLRAPGEKTVQERLVYGLKTVPVLIKAVEAEKQQREERRRSRGARKNQSRL